MVQRIIIDPFGSISSVRHDLIDLRKKKSRAHVQSTHGVVMASGGTEEFERPASFKSPVWGKEVSG